MKPEYDNSLDQALGQVPGCALFMVPSSGRKMLTGEPGNPKSPLLPPQFPNVDTLQSQTHSEKQVLLSGVSEACFSDFQPKEHEHFNAQS